MKASNLNLQVFGMSELMTAVFGEEYEQVLEDSNVYGNFTFGDCDYSLVSVESFIESFEGEAFDALWNEVKASLGTSEDVAKVYVNLVG